MAIPSMSDSSRLTEVPALAYLDEGTSAAGAECPEEPDLQPRVLEELQPEGRVKCKQCQASALTSIEDDSIHSCTSNRSDSSFTSSETENKATVCSFRKRQRKHRMKNKDMRKKNKMRRKARRLVISTHITAECLSRPQQVTPDLWEDADISRLFLRKLNVDFFSTFESRSSISDTMYPNSDVAYIYAESIKGCDSSFCTMDTNNTLLSNNIHISNNSDCVCKSCSSEDSDCDLYVSGNLSGNSIEATAGSFLDEFNFDSTCIYTEWDQKVDSTETEMPDSLTQAEWGSSSSNYSDFSCNTDTKSSSTDADGCALEAICDIKCPDGCAEVFLSGCFDCCDEFGAVKDVCRDTESDSESGELWGVVTQTDRQHFSDFFCEMIKEETQEKDMKKMNVNEGFLFHPKQFLQVKNSEYREGREYSFLRHIQNGSYGDVFSIRDKQTGFTCAAKRIPICSFGWQEVETWSRMESPRVLQLFGVVREGHNIILFMDLKRGSLAQLLRLKARLSEDLALYYHCQVLQALQHLHSRRVVHLDVKVDNVLLSEDGRQCFLCDFGLSETLNQGGYSTKTFRGNLLRGTESHMPPEVARGDPRSAKADVWSSCCMLLHMLSGHQPWTRYYPHPLCLKIVSEPPPLWEIPADCDPLTCDVIKAGLVKEPTERDSASELLQKSITALRAEQKDTSLLESPEPRPLTQTSCCDSEQDLSEEDSDDLSSGVFSSCSTTDGQSFNVDWSVSTNQTPSCYFEGLGVDIWVEDVSGESLKIRERPQVKIGHIAVGISEQISLRTFSLATLDGRLVSPDTEVHESGMWLQCVPAPDGSPSWDWRIRDGKLELQEYDDLSDTCSTVAL
nr:mitogen-activated protein kinase kinase kinase 14 isoform X3 [Danio rerio]|eukprot:XP_021326064.1 mitogen-activated protein kinase kinase kinase 14 isoform X3 [Danio rerio]